MDVSTSAFFRNEEFENWKDLFEWVQNVARSCGYVVVIRRSISKAAGYVCKKILMCDRGCSYRKTPSTSGKNTRSKKTGCPFKLTGRYSKMTNRWKLRVIRDEHNHPPANDMRAHAYARRLTEPEYGLTQELLNQNIPPRDILFILKERNPNNVSSPKTIYNAKTRMRMIKNKVHKRVTLRPPATMTGAVINPAQLPGTADPATGQTASLSYVNSVRISVIFDRLLLHLRNGVRNDNMEFFNLCVALARDIDYAVTNSEIPARAPDLPHLLKQVCQQRNDNILHAGIMVLMISVKNACRNGWFSEKDNEELHILSNEIAGGFCSIRDMNCEESTFRRNISALMSRFYPRMKMDEILAFVEATPGYGAIVKDFNISKHAKSLHGDKIYLFVAQTDSIETPSCIVSPQHVNFLLNGKAVDRRTCVNKDPGPQIPTLVTHMLKYGTNLLQAVGQFNGKYVIAVAFMSMVSNPSCPTLPDYVPPVAASPDSDSEIIEGPSRISLNCPISFTRIKTPVKGHLCKHLQCFDFDNYVDINSRRPSWRCPHCSQSVCFHEIRIDQSMVKVLKEVGSNVSHVKISGDGSWEAVNETDDQTDETTPLLQESTPLQDAGADIFDLTEDNIIDIDATISRQDNETKPSPPQLQSQHNANNPIHAAPHMHNGFWRDVHLPIPTQEMFNARYEDLLNAISQGQSQISQGQSQSQIPIPNNMQHNNLNSNEYGRYPTPARYITRNPIAFQALPVQPSVEMADSARQYQASRFHLNHHQVLGRSLTLPSRHMGSENWVHHDRSHVSTQPVQQFGARLSSPQQTPHYRYASAPQTHQQPLNQRIPHPFGSPEGGGGPTTGLVSSQQAHYSMAGAQRTIQIGSLTPSRSPTVASSGEQRVLGQGQGQSQSQGPRVLEVSADAPADQNWRPTGRMRGSLSGQAYSDALNRYMIHPTQPVQATRPPVLNSARPMMPPHLQALMANRNAQGLQDGPSGPAVDGFAGDLPEY